MYYPKFLSKDYPLEKQYLLVPRFNFRGFGFYPERNKPLLIRLWAVFNFVLLAYGSFAEFFFGMRQLNVDVLAALDALCPVASSATSLFKMCCMWWYNERFCQLIERVWQLSEQQKTPAKDRVKRKYFSFSTNLIFWTSFMGFLTATFYSVRPIALNIIYYIQDPEHEFVYDTPYHMILPEVLLRLPIYPITYILVHWHGYVTVATFLAVDGFFMGFCLYFAALLKIIQIDLSELLTEVPIDKAWTPYQEAEIYHKLSKIIARHNEVADLVIEFSSIMSHICLGHFLTSSFVIGSSIVDMLLIPGYGGLLYFLHAIAVTMELFIYCVGGSAVMDVSEDTAIVAYSTHWPLYSNRIKKQILMMIIRSQRSFVVKVPFFAPSLPAFASILRFTGSLITLVKSVV